MTSRNEKITKFLYELKNGSEFLAAEEDDIEIEDLLKEVLPTGLVKLEKEHFTLTREGILLTSLGKTYDGYLTEKQLKPAATRQIGHLIIGSKNSNTSLPAGDSAGKQMEDKNIKQVVKQASKIAETIKADATLSAPVKEQALTVLATLITAATSGKISPSTYENLLEIGGQITSIGPMVIALLPFMPKPLTL